ncbi:MAG: ATP synthase F1 subunit delta [Cloacibacterium sp.]|nr:ATP synthase F1 subunit delta [Cloacibacterium sp.]
MRTSKVAKRYAQGLLDFTQESGNTGMVFSEMKDISKTISSSKELQNFFATPIIDTRKKVAVAKEIFSQFSPVSQNMISLVIKQGRENHLGEIADEYIKKVEELSGIQKIALTTAIELSPESIKNIIESSHLVSGDKYEVKTSIKPDILGGYILRVGDQQIDNSVKTKLGNIKKEFQLN